MRAENRILTPYEKRIIMKNDRLRKLIKNKNFRNNQNYIFNLSYKNKIINYAHSSYKDSSELKMYDVNNNNLLKNHLNVNDFSYIQKGSLFNFSYYFGIFSIYLFPIFFTLGSFFYAIYLGENLFLHIKDFLLILLYGLFSFLVGFLLFIRKIILIKNHFIFTDITNLNKIYLMKYRNLGYFDTLKFFFNFYYNKNIKFKEKLKLTYKYIK